jgi:DNA-binding transcriptional LysR family regulator
VTPADLEQHACLGYTYAAVTSAWTFESRDGTRHTPRIVPRHRLNNGRMLAELAAAGLGIVLEPDFIVAPEVRSGRLQRLLTDYQPPRSPIAAVYPSRRHLSAKVRRFVDFLAARYSQDQDWVLSPAVRAG